MMNLVVHFIRGLVGFLRRSEANETKTAIPLLKWGREQKKNKIFHIPSGNTLLVLHDNAGSDLAVFLEFL
jgi:hypothetical protein